MPVAAEGETVAVSVMLVPVAVLDAEDLSVVVVAVVVIVEDVLLLLLDPQPVNSIVAMQNTAHTTKGMSGICFISRTSYIGGLNPIENATEQGLCSRTCRVLNTVSCPIPQNMLGKYIGGEMVPITTIWPVYSVEDTSGPFTVTVSPAVRASILSLEVSVIVVALEGSISIVPEDVLMYRTPLVMDVIWPA